MKTPEQNNRLRQIGNEWAGPPLRNAMEPLKPTPLPGIPKFHREDSERVAGSDIEAERGISIFSGPMKCRENHLIVLPNPGREPEIILDFRSTDPTAETPPGSVNGDSMRGQGETILVIEDDFAVRKVVQALLKMIGYNSLAAEDGLTGLACYREHREIIKAVITDMTMRGVQGTEIIRELRVIHPDVRIVAMSGLFSKPLEAAEESGCLTFLHKPMTGEDLLKALCRVMPVQSA